MAGPIVDLQNVSKTFGNKFKAVDGMTMSIPKGIIYGLLGPNGAGKTTTIRMIMRIIYPDSGDIRIFGEPLTQVSKDRIGYLPEERGVYKKMKVGELLTFFGEIKSMSPRDAKATGLKWLDRLELKHTAQKKVEELSKGMQQKVQFISTIMHEPELIILDEPFSGLDPVNSNVLKDIILEFHRKGHTIIFSTHMMEQVEKLCDEICLINKGKKVLDGGLNDVKKEHGHNTITMRFDGDGSFLAGLDAVDSVNDHGKEIYLRLKDGADPSQVLREAASKLDVQRFELSEPSIHDIFRREGVAMKWTHVFKREFFENVRKKSFIISTIAAPVIMAGFYAIPIALVFFQPNNQMPVEVLDHTGKVAAEFIASVKDTLDDGRPRFLVEDVTPADGDFESAKTASVARVRSGEIDALIEITPETLETSRVSYIAKDEFNEIRMDYLRDQLSPVIIGIRLANTGLEYDEVAQLTQRVRFNDQKITKSGVMEERAVTGEYILVMFFVMILVRDVAAVGDVDPARHHRRKEFAGYRGDAELARAARHAARQDSWHRRGRIRSDRDLGCAVVCGGFVGCRRCRPVR